VLADDFYLWDTPGMLWPRIIIAESGQRLAASGAIGRNAYDDESTALHLLAYLQQHYEAALAARYKSQTIATLSDDQLLEHIARQRGALLTGARIDRQKAAEIVLTDFRSAALGAITLETPAEYAAWQAAAALQEQARAERKRGRR